MQQSISLDIRQLDLKGVQTLVRWAREEGWNPGPFDADIFFHTDPEGFVGIFEGDEMLGGGSVVSYGGKLGFMGLFIIKPGYRNRGIGRKLWFHRRDQLIRRLDKGAPIGMDGVVDMQPFYASGGFEIAFRDERYQRLGVEFQVDPRISEITESDIPQVLQYDQEVFGAPRQSFMKPWLRIPGAKAFQFVRENHLEGFAVIRPVEKGYKIGPLFADNFDVAKALYQACLSAFVGEPIFLDIPVHHKEAKMLVKSHDAAYESECARMYYGSAPAFSPKVFGITSFELG
ncbi:GNAT family N-acetyltransferase [Pontibacter sp. G13]|uniref:GNAT family N-acetyltransferase n=1 Tax=Pontibacter sp. G13 TaxID=3074898 RepID=UPI002889AD5A|nr:GNAT family N-acetyltransferase [Pontibacter sp. G13]WNJ18451.1 GNAT family N-acetyltransferase [Pontibacter sp. G13]